MTGTLSGGRILVGAMWGYGAQILTIVCQLVYAAVVSRLAGANEFGAYGVALSITALISLLANGGMSQAVARLMVVDKSVVGAMSSFALILGALVAAITFLTAGFWAALWGAPSAAETIRWLSISALFSPMFSLLTGLTRRTGQFSHLAMATVLCNIVGMVGGIFAVRHWGSAPSLVVSAVLAQFCLVVWLGLRFRSYLLPRSLTVAIPHIAFSAKLIMAGVLQYAVGNLGKWSATRTYGAAVMGQWNRAEVLTTVPMQQAQTAMVQAVYPEFRHDVGSSIRAKAVWAEMLLLVAWFSAPAGMALVVITPIIIPVVLGAEWTQAAEFAVPLCIGVALQPVSVLLASALEALGSFRRIWLTDLILLVLQIFLVVVMLVLNDVAIIVWGVALTNGARLMIHSVIAAKIGYLNLRTLIGGCWKVALGCVLTFGFCKALEQLVLVLASGREDSYLALGGILFVVGGASIALAYRWRNLPPVRLAVKYGLIREKGRF